MRTGADRHVSPLLQGERGGCQALAAMAELPSGAITFLFTDIEGSTATDQTDRLVLALASAGIALTADTANVVEASRLRGAVATLRQSVESSVPAQDEELERRFEQPLIDALGEEAYATEQAIGMEMTLDDAIASHDRLPTAPGSSRPGCGHPAVVTLRAS